MPEFSLSKVGILKTGKPGKRTPPAVAEVDASDAILAVAKIIDPDAWGEQPQPSLDQLRQQVADLTDDVEWLSTVPTTPEGEYNLIRSETRRRDMVLVSGQIQPTAATTIQRQNMALERARMALDAFNKFTQAKRRVLIKVVRRQGKPSWFSQSVRHR